MTPTLYFAISAGAAQCSKKNLLIFKKMSWKKKIFFEGSDIKKKLSFSSMDITLLKNNL